MLALTLTLALGTLTVDDDGPADYADINDAIAAASDGDVILIADGLYFPFALDKSLTLLGDLGGPRPRVLGESTVAGVETFTLAGLQLHELLVDDVPGRGRIDDCQIGHGGVSSVGIYATFRIANCEQVLVTRSTCQGKTGNDSFYESPGILVVASTVAVVDCLVYGGRGGDAGFDGYPGQPGIDIYQGSDVLVAGTTAIGGDGGDAELPIFGCDSSAASAIEVDESTLTVRGNRFDDLVSGYPCGQPGRPAAIFASGSTVTVSGVALDPTDVVVFDGDLIEPDPAEPYLVVRGESGPGQTRRLNLYGPAGDVYFLLLAFAPDYALAPGLIDGAIWLDTTALFPVVPIVQSFGQITPSTLNWPLPADSTLAGVTVGVQAFRPELDGTLFALNPSNVVLRD